jgi:hypothetical protein
MISIDGILRCSRYSFGPNRLHYCGPDQNVELRALIEAGEMAKDSGLGLTSLLKHFKEGINAENGEKKNCREDERVIAEDVA